MYEVTDPTVDALKASAFAQRIYSKRVRSAEDIGKWKRSTAYYDIVAYINNTSMAIQGHRQGGGYIVTKQMEKLCKIFNWLDRLVYECHPLGVGQGLLRCVGEDKIALMESTNSLRHKCHRAFKSWMKLVQEKVFSILEHQVKPHCKHINELAHYLTRSFGSLQHYDYGPGNELMFIFYLCGLFKSGILTGEDTVAAALMLFQRYLDLVRRLMTFFRLPATCRRDHNTIDDRNILPYLWGCAQLCRRQPFAPPQWDQPAIVEAHRKDYMLLSSLEHLQKTMNHGPIGVHSYQLWCVLSLTNWPDAYSGLMGSYVKYVLNDFYTVQDLIFSEMLSFARQPLESLPVAYLGELPTQELPSFPQAEQVEGEGEESLDKKRNVKKESLMPLQPPVTRHESLNTDVFLGIANTFNASEHAADANAKSLRRPRILGDSAFNKSSTMLLPPHHSDLSRIGMDSPESVSDILKLNNLLGIDPSSKTESFMSFYSI